jgi:hypothetical protein
LKKFESVRLSLCRVVVSDYEESESLGKVREFRIVSFVLVPWFVIMI